MMDAATHTGFIIAAYAVAIAVVGGLTAWVMLDYRAQLRRLADLDTKGISRHAAPTTKRAREDA